MKEHLDLIEQLAKLEDQTGEVVLGCWCKPKFKECHGDTLATLVQHWRAGTLEEYFKRRKL
jgi:hypothetical protein